MKTRKREGTRFVGKTKKVTVDGCDYPNTMRIVPASNVVKKLKDAAEEIERKTKCLK